MTPKITFLINFAAIMVCVRGYSAGAPVEVCNDMKPQHPYESQISAIPYQVIVNKDKIKAGEKVKISISDGKPFKGFLVQVREAAGLAPVGRFSVDKEIGKTIDCENAKTAVTHINDSYKSVVYLEWTSPVGVSGMYTVL